MKRNVNETSKQIYKSKEQKEWNQGKRKDKYEPYKVINRVREKVENKKNKGLWEKEWKRNGVERVRRLRERDRDRVGWNWFVDDE